MEEKNTTVKTEKPKFEAKSTSKNKEKKVVKINFSLFVVMVICIAIIIISIVWAGIAIVQKNEQIKTLETQITTKQQTLDAVKGILN